MRASCARRPRGNRGPWASRHARRAVVVVPGRWYTTLYDGGLGIVTRHQVKDMEWTMRFELPLAVNPGM